MNNIINFYYGINVVNIYEYKTGFLFSYNGTNYYFIKYDRDRNDLNGLINICIELKNRNILTNEFVSNRYNSYLTPFNNELYVLIRENVVKHKININDILYIQNNTVNISFDKNISRLNSVDLWKNKIDFYEKKSIGLSNKYKLLNNTLDYYIGLGENAIIYLINNNVKNDHMVLSHRRLGNYDFYNPLNYILDSRARDIADYIKKLFFYEGITIETVLSILNYINFNREEYILFIARMLYPTYYFDLVDKIIFFNEDEDILKKVIDKSDEYINLLKKLFYYINYNLRMNIPIIEWIIKK